MGSTRLRKAITLEGPPCYNRKELDILAEKGLNGRQVGILTGCSEAFPADQSFTRSKILYPQPMLWQLGREVGSPLLISESLLTRAMTSNAISEGRVKLAMHTLIM